MTLLTVTLLTSSPFICQEVMGQDAMILVFWMLSFKPAFSLSSFTLIKRLVSSSLLSAIRVVSSTCPRFLIFLPAILVPACDSSSPAFHNKVYIILICINLTNMYQNFHVNKFDSHKVLPTGNWNFYNNKLSLPWSCFTRKIICCIYLLAA